MKPILGSAVQPAGMDDEQHGAFGGTRELGNEWDGTFESAQLDLTPGPIEEATDIVRTYLREAGRVPLLTREGEVSIARRIERGRTRVARAISRSPVAVQEILLIGQDLRSGIRSVKEIVHFGPDELNDERILKERARQALKVLERVSEIHRTALKQAAVLERTPETRKRAYLHARYRVARTRIQLSALMRSLDLSAPVQKHLAGKVSGAF
ncbi:MAG: sigma-70 factor domain-containing protein, partial [Terriglobia bacterium]